MPMKHLKEFRQFDLDGFLKDKIITVSDIKQNVEYSDGKPTDNIKGTTIVCIIKRDNTKYKGNENKANYEVKTNEDNKFNVKIPSTDIVEIYNRLPKNKPVKLLGVKNANVWGNFQNELSVECDDVVLIERKE
ncbi:hypothetical protein [Staphylococcus warneri]|uniref:hypothetical protein n=1 Tax=Staphylococcus warneri TaxID=1292 RepID=UPI00167A2377|nr:hypothetical protein [Staphylococcus warneri]